MNRYSIKMRASNKEEGHISGAEKIIPEEELEQYCSRLLTRALGKETGAVLLPSPYPGPGAQ